jgi:hypothetical protein
MNARVVKTAAALILAAAALVIVWTPLVQRQVAARRVAVLDSMLQQLGEPYSQVQALRSTHPRAWLIGEVVTDDDWRALFREVAARFGEREARRIMKNVRVRQAAVGESA